MPVQWTPALSVGVADIDEQHQELFVRLGKMLAAMKSGDREEMARLLDFLGEYVLTHFATEEKLMREAEYPAFAMHKAAHDHFVRDLIDVKADFKAKGPVAAVAIQLGGTVGEWIKAHIAGTDLHMARHLRAWRQAQAARKESGANP